MKNFTRNMLIPLLLLPLFGCGRLDPFYEDYEHFRKNAKIGMTEQHVRDKLGVPNYEYSKVNAPEDYYVKGWAYKERVISFKVLIYQKAEPICYVWIDPSGKVEDVFIGGS